MLLSQFWGGELVSSSPSFELLCQVFFLPPQLNQFPLRTLSVWMSVKLLPVYQTLVTNTIANTARLLVQKKVLCVCVCVFVCTHVCIFYWVFLCSLSRAASHLCCERRSVEAKMYFLMRQNVLQIIKASFINNLSEPPLPLSFFFLPVTAQTSAAEADMCARLSPWARHPLCHLRRNPWRLMTCVFIASCVRPGLHLGSVTRTAVQSVKLFGLNFSNWSISEGLRQAELNWS